MNSIYKKIDEELKRLDREPAVKFQYQEEPKEKETPFVCLGPDMATSTWNDLMIQPLDLANLTPLLNSVSLTGCGSTGTNNMGAASGYNYTNSGIYTTTPTPAHSPNWGSLNTHQVHITNTGIDMSEHCDITIGSRSMKKILDDISQRLSILVPDPAKLERYEALRQAYEHYRTLEALCIDNKELGNKK